MDGEEDGPRTPDKPNDQEEDAMDVSPEGFQTPCGTLGPSTSSSRARQRTTSESLTGVEQQAKRLCTAAAQEVPGSSGAGAAPVNPSPPTLMSLEEVMSAADGMKNMVLAHEIALDADFALRQAGPAAEGSLHARINEMMHKAFWDLLTSELAEDPPCYTQAMELLREIKEMLVDMVPQRAVSLRTDIEQKLDVELIQQQAEAGTLNFKHYAEYVVYTMGRMCCPARDEDVQALAQLQEVVPTFKGILEVLKKMKIDYANFTIQEARPIIIANSVEYEKKKFGEFLKTQRDGLQVTRDWLLRHKEALLTPEQEAEARSNPSAVENKIISAAFVEALTWTQDHILPETLVLDKERLQRMGERMRELVVVASVILVSLPVVGASVRDLVAFKLRLKDRIKVLLQDTGYTDEALARQLPNVAAQVERDVVDVLALHELPSLSSEARGLLTGQIEAVANPEHSIRQLANSRVQAFLAEVSASSSSKSLLVPAGFSAVTSELGVLAGQFGNLVWYNRCVFGRYYSDILGLRPPTTSNTNNNET